MPSRVRYSRVLHSPYGAHGLVEPLEALRELAQFIRLLVGVNEEVVGFGLVPRCQHVTRTDDSG